MVWQTQSEPDRIRHTGRSILGHDRRMHPTLDRTDGAKVFLRDGTYRWLIVKRFTATGHATIDPSELLATLIAHPAYRDHFASPDSETEAPIHGPYRLDAVTVDEFERVTPAKAEAIMRDWLDQFGAVASTQVDGDLESLLNIIRRSSLGYYLPDLGKTAQHDWGWIVNHFHDIVAVGPGQQIALIAVGSD